jgi:hypothetical protein
MKNINMFLFGCIAIFLPFSASFGSEQISSSGYKTGTFAEGMEKTFDFYAKENESYLIELDSSEDLIYFFGIYSPESSEPIRYTRVYPNSAREIIFTPVATETYEFRLVGMYRYGKYAIDIDHISDSTSSSPKRISIGTTKTGTIAEGQTQLFEFYGKENNPLIFYVKSDGKVWFLFRLIDPDSGDIIEQRWVTRNEWTDVIFTPPESKLYHVALVGAYDYGKYVLNIQKIPVH